MSERSPTILLFDLDGTLVDTGGAGRRALVRAFAEQGAGADALDFYFGGMTDRAIVRRGLASSGRVFDEAAMTAIVEGYLRHLVVELERGPGYRVLPGVEDLLEGLAGHCEVAVGLGTGNVRPGAELKLAPSDLMRFFPFGGFGSDAEDRSELLRVGAARGAERLGHPIDSCRVLIIGDTPRDVAAAHAIGAGCLAVATGHDPASALASAEAVVADLSSISPDRITAIARHGG